MTGVPLRFFWKRVACDDAGPLLARPDEDIRFKPESLCGSGLDETLRFRRRANVASKHDVAALQQRLHIQHAETGQEFTQLRHPDLVVRSEIHGSKQTDIGRHECSLLLRRADARSAKDRSLSTT